MTNPQAVRETKPLTVLCHNVFWFQGTPFPTDTPPDPDPRVMAELCRLYLGLAPDVVCLQEIQNRETFEAVSQRLGMGGCYCPGKELRQYGGAVFWRTGLGRRALDSGEVAEATQRMWQVVEVKGEGRALRICNAHLPSARQLGRDAAAVQRQAEMRGAIQSCDPAPDIVVGDFNELPGGPVSDLMAASGYADAAALAGRQDAHTSLKPKRGDYIWIKKPGGPRLLSYQAAEKEDLACRIEGKEYLSDHLPLWVAVSRFPPASAGVQRLNMHRRL